MDYLQNHEVIGIEPTLILSQVHISLLQPTGSVNVKLAGHASVFVETKIGEVAGNTDGLTVFNECW